MRVAVVGATGRTGRLVVAELLRRGLEVRALIRPPRTVAFPDAVAVVRGDARDRDVLVALLRDCDAVCSALGPSNDKPAVNSSAARVLIEATRMTSVNRFVGVSGAGSTVPGDRKRVRDRLLSAALQRFGGATVADKVDEHELWAVSGLGWTLVRPPRLTDRPATGEVEHAASTSPHKTTISRADLAAFLVDCVERGSYPNAARW